MVCLPQPRNSQEFALGCSFADPGCLSRIPHPDFFHPRSRIQQKKIREKNKLFVLPFLVENFFIFWTGAEKDSSLLTQNLSILTKKIVTVDAANTEHTFTFDIILIIVAASFVRIFFQENLKELWYFW